MLDRSLASRIPLLFVLACTAGGLAPPPAGAVVLETQLGCQKALTKGTQSHLARQLKRMARCSLEHARTGTDACADPKVVEGLAKEDTKLGETLTKACGSLTDAELGSPRPGGLAVAANADLFAVVKNANDHILGRLLAASYGEPGAGGSVLSPDALDCQASLDKAVAARVKSAFKQIGSACQDQEDKGKTVVGESSHIVEACAEAAALALDADAAKILAKRVRCTPTAILEVPACPKLTFPRDVESVASCLLDASDLAVRAAIGAAHGRENPRLRGRIETGPAGTPASVAAIAAAVLFRGHGAADVTSPITDPRGYVDVAVPPLDTYTVCLQRGGVETCSSETIEVGVEPVYFDTRRIDFPTAAGEQAVVGRVQRSDGSPCYEDSADAAFTLRGGIVVSPTGAPPSGERTPVDPRGQFIVGVSSSAPQSLHADCGDDSKSVDLGPPPVPPAPVTIQMTNPVPSASTVTMVDDQGMPITDPSQVSPGEVISLHGSATDDDALEFRWEITQGDGHFVGVTGDDRHARGPDAQWQVGTSDGIHQVTMWASDRQGGVESVVAPVGPIIGNLSPGPCIAGPKLQKLLCATGYTANVPAPASGLSSFLTYKYRNPSSNSAGDACLYYNLVDPDCIDMNCDGVVDAGTDPTGKCKRTTLGGWWQKNGFDSNGLGSDVVSAWYLNSNDLGFGREMHCRVTSWSSIIAEKPADAILSRAKFEAAVASDISAATGIALEKVFNHYPSTVACYVTNYTTDHCFKYPTNDPQNAALAYQGQFDFVANPTVNPTNAYGTVAMEFGPVENFGQLGAVTKFFVYNGRTASGKRLTSANLDGCGPKSVPEVCMNCHGGSWPGDYSQGTTLDSIVAGLGTLSGVLAGIDSNDTLSTDAGYQLRESLIDKITREEYGFSSFLPFDPDTYVFPPAAPSATQAPSLRSLNQIVLYTKPKTPISDLIKGWYSNNLLSGTWAPWRPTAWNDDGGQPGDESDLHDEVYARACRVCHAAHYSFSSWMSFPGSSRICKNGSGDAGGFMVMPHAKLTYLNLWKSDYPQALTFSTLESWFTASEGGFTSCD